MIRWLGMGLLLCGVAVQAAPKQAAIYNGLSVPKDAPYGVGALSLSFTRGGQNMLLPGHYVTFRKSFLPTHAMARVAKNKQGVFEEAKLPEACFAFVKPGYALYVQGRIAQGRLHDVDCNVKHYSGPDH